MARFQLRAWAVQFELAKSWLINQNNNQAISGSYGQTSDTSTKLKKLREERWMPHPNLFIGDSP
ncbi:uncharacterized protein Dsimw501_GD27885 [Drosophila simulans]|uniref:Uncharacterized protein n=1 Tax=Drosophila simulans TaxID=7240 RepID=A0A0J9R2S1_DROSI|nr:uncharacterized protein Dsimw501_GD27885 [Drosophila simulans]